MPRYNPPPSWPTPPPGWAPTPDWRPDPTWGPPPPGWPLWVPSPGEGRRTNPAAFGQVGVVAGVLYVVVLLAQVGLGSFSAYDAGAAFGASLVPWLIVSLLVLLTRPRWSWFAIAGAYLGVWLVLNLLSTLGRIAGAA